MDLMQDFHARKQPLDSRQLLAFAALARTRSFTQAGKQLFLSQSAISHALKVLETDLACRLVDRVGKKIQLTPAGENFLHHTQKILSDMTEARASLERLAKWGKGRLRVGASESIRQYLLPQVILKFQKEFPDWPISVEAADTQQSIELLRQQKIDLAINIAPSQAEPVDIVPLFMDELAWVMAPDHPWARSGTVVATEISGQKLILNRTSSYTYCLLKKYFQHGGAEPRVFLELGNLEAIKETVQRGLGVAILPHWVITRELKKKELVALPLGRRKLRRNWCVLRSLDSKADLAGETFVKLCRSLAPANPAALKMVRDTGFEPVTPTVSR